MRRFLFLSVLLCGQLFSLHAQSRYFNLNVDNDLFFVTDYYYSSGIFLQYGRELKTEDEEDVQRQFRLWELGQEIYTPPIACDRRASLRLPLWRLDLFKHSRQKSAQKSSMNWDFK